jgi:hypothetical protein
MTKRTFLVTGAGRALCLLTDSDIRMRPVVL